MLVTISLFILKFGLYWNFWIKIKTLITTAIIVATDTDAYMPQAPSDIANKGSANFKALQTVFLTNTYTEER